MAKRKLKCPHCGNEWEYSYWQWVWKAQIHCFNFIKWKDKRYTKCPNCGKKSWIYSEKSN